MINTIDALSNKITNQDKCEVEKVSVDQYYIKQLLYNNVWTLR